MALPDVIISLMLLPTAWGTAIIAHTCAGVHNAMHSLPCLWDLSMSLFSIEVCPGLKCIFPKIYKQIFYYGSVNMLGLLVCFITVRYLDIFFEKQK